VKSRGRLFGRCRCQEHYIFFRETADMLDVVRIFHAKMDVVRRLADE
jgi:plasmid stabilization system protein ParE